MCDMRDCIKRFAGAALAVFLVQRVLGQACVLESAIPPSGGPDGAVWAVLALDDGKILVGGSFNTIGGESHAQLARLLSDGSIDSEFVDGADGNVNRMVRQSDGKILISGAFSQMQGLPRQGLARLFADGTVDPDFDPGTNYSSGEGVLSIAVQADLKIVTSSYLSFDVSRLKRLNSDGTLDTSFTDTNVFDYYITALLPRTNGTILVGGGFQTVNGESRVAIALVDDCGVVQPVTNAPLQPYSDIFSFVEQTNGCLFVGGILKSETNTTLLGRLTQDLAWDETFVPDTFDAEDTVIETMVLQPDGKLVVAGNFTAAGGYSRRGVARLDAEGHVDPCFDPGLGMTGAIGATSMDLQNDGRVLLSGWFSGDLGITNIARLRAESDCGATHVFLRQRFDGFVSVAATCTPGGTNILESSENLIDWSEVGASFDPYLPFFDFDISSAPALFFRIRKE